VKDAVNLCLGYGLQHLRISRVLDGVKTNSDSCHIGHDTPKGYAQMIQELDKPVMLRPLARLKGSALRGRALGRAIVILAVLMTYSFAAVEEISPAIAEDKQPFHIDNVKLYAYNKMDWDEFQCYNALIHRESSWRPEARNGSHWGLGQMRSEWYGTLDAYAQVDAHIKYLHHRYPGKYPACLAYEHWERKGWH